MTLATSPPRIGRRDVLALAGGLLAAPAIVRAQGHNGVALVVGNSRYLCGANFAAFYFAGHGALFDGYTYVVPIDVDLSSPSAAAELVGLPAIIETVGGAANRLIALDNCRNNPSTAWRQRHTTPPNSRARAPWRLARPPRPIRWSSSPRPGAHCPRRASRTAQGLVRSGSTSMASPPFS